MKRHNRAITIQATQRLAWQAMCKHNSVRCLANTQVMGSGHRRPFVVWCCGVVPCASVIRTSPLLHSESHPPAEMKSTRAQHGASKVGDQSEQITQRGHITESIEPVFTRTRTLKLRLRHKTQNPKHFEFPIGKCTWEMGEGTHMFLVSFGVVCGLSALNVVMWPN